MAASDDAVAAQLADQPCIAIPIPTITADTQLSTRPGLLVGWSLRETTGSAAAAVEFIGAVGTTAPVVGEQQMASGLSGSFQVGPDGAYCPAGLSIHVVSGSVRGVAYYRQ